jgi:hypothetical protein
MLDSRNYNYVSFSLFCDPLSAVVEVEPTVLQDFLILGLVQINQIKYKSVVFNRQ